MGDHLLVTLVLVSLSVCPQSWAQNKTESLGIHSFKIVRVQSIRFDHPSTLSQADQQAITTDFVGKDFDEQADANSEAEQYVRELYMNRGYFNAKVEASARTTQRDGDEVWVELRIRTADEGLQYRLKEIVCANNTAFTCEQLRSLIPLSSGDVFRRDKIGEGLETIRRAYAAKGYVNFTSVPDTIFDDENATITLKVDVDEGGQFTFAGGAVSGLTPARTESVVSDMASWKGQLYTPTLFPLMFERLRPLLPPCAGPDRFDAGLRLDDGKHTVSVVLDFEDCYGDWLNSKSSIPIANCCPK